MGINFYSVPDDQRYGREELGDTILLVQEIIARTANPEGATVVELGAGKGALQNVHPNYIGIDLSLFALEKYLKKGRRVQADIQVLPLADESADVLVSIATLEHVPRPEACLAEIHRVLKPNGFAFLHPAWFCRPWASKALPSRPYRELQWKDRFEKFTIPIQENLVIRALGLFPVRLAKETMLLLGRKPINFRYRRLTPNLDSYVYPDSDAFVSMDPHEAILFFMSRGYLIHSANTFLERLLVRHRPVIVQKLSARGL